MRRQSSDQISIERRHSGLQRTIGGESLTGHQTNATTTSCDLDELDQSSVIVISYRNTRSYDADPSCQVKELCSSEVVSGSHRE